MQSNFLKNTCAEAAWLVIHPLSQEDSVAVAALRIEHWDIFENETTQEQSIR